MAEVEIIDSRDKNHTSSGVLKFGTLAVSYQGDPYIVAMHHSGEARFLSLRTGRFSVQGALAKPLGCHQSMKLSQEKNSA